MELRLDTGGFAHDLNIEILPAHREFELYPGSRKGSFLLFGNDARDHLLHVSRGKLGARGLPLRLRVHECGRLLRLQIEVLRSGNFGILQQGFKGEGHSNKAPWGRAASVPTSSAIEKLKRNSARKIFTSPRSARLHPNAYRRKFMAEKNLEGLRVEIIATDYFEQAELERPKQALDDAGADTKIISVKPSEIQGVNHVEKGNKFKVDMTLTDARPDQFDAVLLPGGAVNADFLRVVPEAQQFVREFDH